MPLTKIAGKKSIALKKPKLFASSYVRQVAESTGEVPLTSGEVLDDSNIRSTSSFRYDPPGVGLKSTQQVPLDWADFSQHTFFNSAEAKVNVAFNRIINEYPFDGTRQELEEYLDSLTGFEGWVLQKFPRNLGFLVFPSGSTSYISVNDFAGSTFQTLAKNKSGDKILDPEDRSFTLEMHLYVTGGSNVDQVVCQNVRSSSSGHYGYTVGIATNVSTTQGTAYFVVSSGSSVMSASTTVTKDVFSHLAFTCDRRPGINTLKIYSGSALVASSSQSAYIGDFGFTTESFTIGSGTSHGTLSPTQTFRGAIDELRVFHVVRSPEELTENAWRNVYPSEDLKLYFKFNEPTGSLGDITSVVIDSSGNSLHSQITNFTGSMRTTGSYPSNPIRYEKSNLNPVLFPAYEGVVDLNEELLNSGSIFDNANPNLITRLIPPHYLQQGQVNEGFQNELGDIGDAYEGTGLPGSGQMGSTHILSALLYIWAKHFDEVKIFIDHFSNLLHVDYDDAGTAADQFLPYIFRHNGFDVPSMFSNASIRQFFNAEDVGVEHDSSDLSLQQVQNQIWRRILTNLGEIVRSKGTMHSVKSFLRAVGINPDTSLRIREFGGVNNLTLGTCRQTKTEVSSLLDMSGSLAALSPTLDIQGVPSNKPFLRSAFLSGSRIEVGIPSPRGTFVRKSDYPVHGISNDPSDGLFTSGSWTFEGIYKFDRLPSGSHPLTQSLARLNSTGSEVGHIVWANLIALSGTDGTSRLKLFARPTYASTGPTLEMELSGVNFMDGSKWNVSFGRVRHDQIGSVASSSWFLRAGRFTDGFDVKTFTTATFFQEALAAQESILQRVTSSWNASGSFITVGSQSVLSNGTVHSLNSSTLTGSEVRYTDFSGRIGQIRFWSKNTSEGEWLEHVECFKSVGVLSPSTNFNFATHVTGAFERLRLDVSTDQPTTASDASGRITLFDFSQANSHISGTGFEASKQVIDPESFRYTFLSPKFDEASTDQKVRIRGLLSSEEADREGAAISPIYEIPASERPVDDTRFTIDFSIVDALDEDIILMFATLDSLDNALGDPNLMFAEDYPNLEVLRDVYFRRLTDKVNLRGFFEFFRWFDSSLGMFIEQLLPRKTVYQGTNFVVESHALERAKVRYPVEDMYMDENLRRSDHISLIILEDGDSFVG